MSDSNMPSTDYSRHFPLDVLGEIFPQVSKNDLPACDLVSRAVVPYVRPVLYRFMQVRGRDIYKVMNTSSQYLAFTKHLRFTYQGFIGPLAVVNKFFKALEGYGQLEHFELVIEWNSTPSAMQDPIYPAFSEFLGSLPYLKKLEVMNISAPHFGLPGLSYIPFLRRVLTHPALISLKLESCRAACILIRGAPKSSPLVSFGLHICNEVNSWWRNLPTSLDLRHLRHLYLEVEYDAAQIPSRFVTIENLTLVFTKTSTFPYMNLTFALSGLHSETLESLCIYIPRPWADLTQQPWHHFFEAFTRFTILSSVTIFFARAAEMISPNVSNVLMEPHEVGDFVNSIKTKSLLPKNIQIVQEG
ncbi:hypothetical protein DL96DRAFT_1805622 [Flagelloscypha sp. PMI_526]|nr:hypothetical protein DL96DRAFT_1805622 [Flagelloscypha sp. PMI_526]